MNKGHILILILCLFAISVSYVAERFDIGFFIVCTIFFVTFLVIMIKKK